MRITILRIACVILATASLLTFPATAGTIAVTQADLSTTAPGATFQILLDEAPAGLSGYRMEIVAGGSPGSQITQVQFPDWTTLYQAGALPAANTSLKAVDLHEAIGPGAHNILLATINLTPGPGATPALVIRSVQIEDDDGKVSTPVFPGSSAQASATPIVTAPPSDSDLPSTITRITTAGTTHPALTPSPPALSKNVTSRVNASPATPVTTMSPVSTTNEPITTPVPTGTETPVPPPASAATPPVTKTPAPAILVLVAAGIAVSMRRT